MNELIMQLVNVVFRALLTELDKEMMDETLQWILDSVDTLAKNSENTVDDALVLPVTAKIRKIRGIS